jgi:aryl-alcohol dehydrogenase-like predicted oxidoreductase
MLQRSFGVDSTRISVLGFGCSQIGSFGNPASSKETQHLLEAALERGITLFDTADVYGQGDSEREIGKLLRGRRDAAFVVSKVGKTFSTKMRLLRPFKTVLKPFVKRSQGMRSRVVAHRENVVANDFSPRRIRLAIDSSLRRLRFETIDALLLHSPSARELEDPELIDALAHARREGKIRHYGVACDDVAALRAALQIPGLSLVEIPPPVFHDAEFHLSARRRTDQVGVLVREIISRRGALTPLEAVRAMFDHPEVSCAIIRTESQSHLDDLVRAVGA